jgi:DNA invertase Pin-like site-specific DNA recombinase
MSSVHQDLSLDAQRKVIEDWAAQAGVEVVAWYEDPARSGSIPPKRRPGLVAALEALETLRAGVLVVAADDRLSRNTDHAGWVATEVKESGAIVVDASKPEDEWVLKMFSRMQAQAYLESLRRNTIRALAVKKARNERVGSLPFGFRLSTDGIHLEENPAEYPTLLLILHLRKAGMGGRRIAGILTAEKYRPRGKSWNPGNLQVMADRLLRSGLSVKVQADLDRGVVRRTKEGFAVTVTQIEVPEMIRGSTSPSTAT